MKELLSQEMENYLRDNQQALVDLIVELCKIPAPSHQEEKRAEFCKAYLEDAGAQGVYIDAAKNCVYPYQCEGDGPIVVVMAHTDTVFPDLEPMPLRIEDGKIYSPGVGDDTTNLAILLLLAKYVAQHQPSASQGVLFVCNSGEEGLGNLVGCRRIMEDYGSRVTEFISLDGSYDSVVNRCVGSNRYRVEVITEGGHSYGAFGNRNAIRYLASMIDTLYAVKVPQGGKTTYNVGMISGGTSVNTIAAQAQMLYEFRSDYQPSLEYMERFFHSVVDTYRNMGITVNVELIGQRPGMGPVPPDKQQALSEKCRAIISQYYKEPVYRSGSTDCNIPCSMGIPAVTFGGYLGAGAHTRGEYVELASLETGFQIVAAVVMSYFEK